jgi:hypothetical protein
MIKRGLVILLVLLLVPFAMAGNADCDETCREAGYEFGKCSKLFAGCGPHGWTHLESGACSLTKCCCADGYKSLTAAGMCDWMVDGTVHGGGVAAEFTCDKKNEKANYYCDEDNTLNIECRDCGLLFCEPHHIFVLEQDPGEAYACIMDNDFGGCDKAEVVPEGNSDTWGYNFIAECGDGVAQGAEECDGEDLRGAQCEDIEPFLGGALACSSDCTYDVSSCLGDPANCGNSLLDPGEQCDGSQLNGQTCESLGFSGGELVCTADCRFSTSGCSEGPCSDTCSPVGATRCQGVALEECMDHNDNGCVSWGVTMPQAEQCCEDGDCSAAACSASGGQWHPDAQSPDFDQSGHCCGDDGASDYFDVVEGWLCTDAGWIRGEEGERYADNRVLFCNSQFRVCHDGAHFQGLLREEHCEQKCGFYCEPQFNRWLDATGPEGLDILSEPLAEGELIDTQRPDLAGGYGCCPSAWCWDGAMCIENQEEEPTNLYVYRHPQTGISHRCIGGAWTEAKLAFSWDNSLKGYCPSMSQCLVSDDQFEQNNMPQAYFSTAKPQCIANSQFVLDWFCNQGEWISRTSLLAAKLLQLGGAHDGGEFELFCDDYRDSLADYSYSIQNLPIAEYIGMRCEINSQTVPCANNFCVFRDLRTGNVIAGTTLNAGLFSVPNGLAAPLEITECGSVNQNNLWAYASCGPNAAYNPALMAVVFSKERVLNLQTVTPWGLFYAFLSNPIRAVSDLVLTGELSYYSITGLPLEFSVLNSSKLFSKVYIAESAGRRIEGVFEEGIYDRLENRSKHYMIVSYYNYPNSVCEDINSFTSEFGRHNCNSEGDVHAVVESRDSKSYLMGRWLDLTTKFSRRDFI